MKSSNEKPNNRKKWIAIGSIISVIFFIVIVLPVGYVFFTLYCWFGRGQDPDKVIKEWRQTRLWNQQQAEGRSIMNYIRLTCPGELPGWSALPYRNDLSGEYYYLLDSIRLQYDYRRPDGSDNLDLTLIVNPGLNKLNWYEANPYIPDTARIIKCPKGVQGWIHEAYPWNIFLPPYDKKPGNPKACMLQIYIGDWKIGPLSAEDHMNLIADQKRSIAKFSREESVTPEWMGADGRIDPMRIPDDAVDPRFTVPASKVLTPASIPNKNSSSVNPRCIAIQIVGRDEAAVMGMLNKVNIEGLSGLIDKK